MARHESMDNVSVLVAEDDEFNYILIKTVLSLNGYRVIRAHNGKEAVGLHRSEKTVDIILMDLQMPVMDGFAAIQEIRKTDEHVPVIVQTTFSMDGMKEKAFLMGCNDFITKPIDPEILLNKMRKYI